ncbi:hypothetical protein M2305_003244 [Gluconobacter cerinus]|uniref:hypothetical protein n=1 Tax=Gluconobacter cerinus TaxID=38307 RepID=UPI002225F5A6|nr:hypothetical protein [Gluconobacter cerinus]MCW2267225.1 hypothetical protein [Gluconobacter cerinus]
MTEEEIFYKTLKCEELVLYNQELHELIWRLVHTDEHDHEMVYLKGQRPQGKISSIYYPYFDTTIRILLNNDVTAYIQNSILEINCHYIIRKLECGMYPNILLDLNTLEYTHQQTNIDFSEFVEELKYMITNKPY